MKTIKVSLLLPYNDSLEVLLQVRKGFINKLTSFDYGFFGGHLEEGEDFKQALIREIKEELTLDIADIKSLEFFGDYNNQDKKGYVERSVNICNMEDVSKMDVREGKPIILKIEEAIKANISETDKKILNDLLVYINKKKRALLHLRVLD